MPGRLRIAEINLNVCRYSKSSMALSAASGGLSLTGIASGIDPNPFPLSDDVLDLRTALPLLRHYCSSFFNAPRVCIKSVL